MAKANPYIDKAIRQAKVLRQLVLRMNEKDREIEKEYDEAEAELKAKKDAPDYPADTMGKFFEESKDYEDKVIADWEPEDENEEILFLCDRVLYRLMAYVTCLILPRKDGHRQATSLVECCSNAAGVA